MKLFKLTVFLLTTLNLIVGKAAFSDNLNQKPQLPQTASKAQVTTPLCFMETATGTKLDLSYLCKHNLETTTKPISSIVSKKYDYKEIEKFNRKVYGD